MPKPTILFLLAILICGIKSQAQQKQPNVIFIIADDLNDAISGMGGHPQALTLNIDKLIDEGVCFTNAHSNDPLCGPSRASLYSGLYPHTSGYFGGFSYDYRQNPTLKDSKTFIEHSCDKRFRYILCINGEEELYDHQNDPFEWRNLTYGLEFQDVKNEMKKKLIDFTRK